MMNVYFVVTATPRGLNIKAQGRAYSRHPGNALKIHVNPNGVEQGCVANVVMCNPVGVDVHFNAQTQGGADTRDPGL